MSSFLRRFSSVMFLFLLFCLTATASPPVSGNGFGFAVVSPETGTLTKFYAHPYSFARPDPKNLFGEGIETTNFLIRLGWENATGGTTSAEYIDDSNVIRARNSSGEGLVFMPFGLNHAAVIVDWQPSPQARHGHFSVEWSHRVRSSRTIRQNGIDMRLLSFDDVPESLLLIPLQWNRAAIAGTNDLSASREWALISLENESEVETAIKDFLRWRAGLSTAALAKREIAEVEHWRVKPPTTLPGEKERHLWRQSEIVLRMAQSREPNRPGRNNNGLIVACLPDGSWSMPWVRDMAYAAVAFARMGHREEARAALLAYFNAQPTGKMKAETSGHDYQVSVVRYFGDGSEESFFTMEGVPNIEFDDWGLVLWVMGEYLQQTGDAAVLKTPTYRGPLYESARDFVVEPLLANLERYGDGLIVAADTSIWEEHQKDKKHFAFSTAMAIVGLRDFAGIAHRAGDDRTRTKLLEKVTQLEKGFRAAFISDGKLHGTLEKGEKNDIDGALLAIINFGLVRDPAIVQSTVERLELLKVVSGGYKRVRSNYTDPSIYEYWYERQEFLFVDFSLAELDRSLGKNDEANAILKRIVDKSAADHNFIPEMYVAEDCKLFHGNIGDPTGAIPMVGYGAGVYILEVLPAKGMK